jgi:pimeloyl-ACP methyl ester carboxylesterase
MAATVDNAGTEIGYEVTGEGMPVVLLHGFPDSGSLWRNQVTALAGTRPQRWASGAAATSR